jgi:RNA polymerase sigma-70 factor (ECF subfamily)
MTLTLKTKPASSRTSDESLLLQYRETGDQSLFETLVHRYKKELGNFLTRYLGNADLAEDVLQLTFFQIHQKSHMFEQGRRFRPWLYRIATNQAIDAVRKLRRHQRMGELQANLQNDPSAGGTPLDFLSSDTPEPSTMAQSNEHGQWARQAVATLPKQLRDVVTLVHFRGLKYREAAENLEIPLGTVKSRMHSALAQLEADWKFSHPHEACWSQAG